MLSYHLYGVSDSVKYEKFHIRKKSGGLRTISAPITAIKIIQRKLSQVLYSVYLPKASVHGFVPSRSIVTNAQQHVHQRYVFNIDVADFFDCIHFGRVRGIFMAPPYELPPNVSTVLAQICCSSNQLPQGAPTSPIVSNMVCARLDSQLRLLAKEKHCRYTRYADDITFSTRLTQFPKDIAYRKEDSVFVGRRLLELIEGNDFKINWKKVRLQHKNYSQKVTGITVNQFPNVDRSFVRKINSMLHVWDRYGLPAARKGYEERCIKRLKELQPELSQEDIDKRTFPLFEEVLRGKINFLGMVRGKNDHIYLKYRKRYRELEANKVASVEVSPIDPNPTILKITLNLSELLHDQSSHSSQKLTKADLVKIAKQVGLKGYSRLRKQDLLELLQQHSLL